MDILAFPRAEVGHLLKDPFSAFGAVPCPANAVLAPRPSLEEDPGFLQLIAYGILVRPDRSIWAYARTAGDGRLVGARSIGVGGHVDAADAAGTNWLVATRRALARELAEELSNPPSILPSTPFGYIQEQSTPIGRVHIGLLYVIPWSSPDAPQPRPQEPLAPIGFFPPEEVTTANQFEGWSQIAAAHMR